MKKLLMSFVWAMAFCAVYAQDYTTYVNPFIGT